MNPDHTLKLLQASVKLAEQRNKIDELEQENKWLRAQVKYFENRLLREAIPRNQVNG
jgi:cell division protein FtsB